MVHEHYFVANEHSSCEETVSGRERTYHCSAISHAPVFGPLKYSHCAFCNAIFTLNRGLGPAVHSPLER